MTLRTTLLVLLPLTLALGCGAAGEDVATSSSVVDQIVAEAGRVAALVSLLHLLSVLLLFGVGVLLTRLADGAIRLFWSLGLDPNHRLGPWRRMADVLVFGALASWLATKLLSIAPVLTALAAILAVAGALWALARPLEDLAAGLGIVLRGRIHEGDHVAIGAMHGTVQEIGLMRMVLRDPEGATLFVPHRLLDTTVVQVHRDRRQVPVSVRIPLPRGASAEAQEVARRVALLSPWRIPLTPVRIELDGDDALRIELQTFTDAAVRLASGQIRAAIDTAMQDREDRRSRDAQQVLFERAERERPDRPDRPDRP